MKKPILRWTLGPVSSLGLQILRESVKTMKVLYPELDLMICHNQLDKQSINFIKKLNVELYEQKHEELVYKPTVENWKMYPPRIDINRHEIVMDNDIILMNRIEEIDAFLIHENATLTTEDTSRNLGKYSKFLKFRNGLNCGIFGMPPGFDFKSKIEEMCKEDKIKKWVRRYDDQGLIAAGMANHPHCIIIPLVKMWILDPFWEIPKIKEDEKYYGIHFAYANRSLYHKAFNQYMNLKMRIA